MTRELEQKIIKDYKSGKTISAIVIETGLKRNDLTRLIKDSDIEIKRGRRGISMQPRNEDIVAEYNNGNSILKIGAKYTMSRQRVFQILMKMNVDTKRIKKQRTRARREETLNKIKSMLAVPMTVEEIAAKMNVGVEYIKNIIATRIRQSVISRDSRKMTNEKN